MGREMKGKNEYEIGLEYHLKATDKPFQTLWYTVAEAWYHAAIRQGYTGDPYPNLMRGK